MRTTTIKLSSLPPDKLEAAKALGKVRSGVWLEVGVDKLERLLGHVAVEQPKKLKDWPLWAKALRLVRKDGDRGVGDTIARTVGPVGGDAFKRWMKVQGKDCGCNERQQGLNRRFRYD